MPRININIPDPLYQKIKDRANAQHCSINSEIIACLEQATLATHVSKVETLLQARRMRKSINTRISTKDIREAITFGRQ
jgi:antitoxin FitA